MSEWQNDRFGITRLLTHRQNVNVCRYGDGRASITLSEEGKVPIVIDLDAQSASRIGKMLLGEKSD